METYSNIVANLNIALEKNNGEFDKLMNDFAKKATSYTSTEWLPIPKDIQQNCVAVFAHSRRPIRALGYIFTHPETQKLVFKRIWFHHKTEKLKIDRDSRKSLELYTCRRGFWLVLKKSLDLHLSLMDVNDLDKIKVLQDCYKTYVYGMDVVPDKSIASNQTEQFKVGQFPTPEWTESVYKKLEIAENKPKKKNNALNKVTGKRKQTGSLDQDEDENESNDESDDWEVVDSVNVAEHPSRYIIVRSGIERYTEPTMNVKIFPDMIPCTSTMECLEQLVPALLDESEYEYV